MFNVSELTAEEFMSCARNAGMILPIEQTNLWSDLGSRITGCSPWGYLRIDLDGELLGLIMFVDYLTHGYHYLRAHHAPVWVRELDAATEKDALIALRKFVAKKDHRQVFMRLAVKHESEITSPCLSMLPYDTTVIVDLSEDPEENLAQMKQRGRRDVRKALRESPATICDETQQACENFADYYELMVETAKRDGFHAGPLSDFENMIRLLSPDHIRVFAARIEGELVAWDLYTINDGVAVRYYAASKTGSGKHLVVDKMIYEAMAPLATAGCSKLDHMGIGSDFAPETRNLNMFKTKFTKADPVMIAPDRDIAIKQGFYGTLKRMKAFMNTRAEKRAAKTEEQTMQAPREDLMPVILGGDISAYALSREFHMAFNVTSTCLVPAPIAVVEDSQFIDVIRVDEMTATCLLPAICELASRNSDKKLVLVGNTDALMEVIAQMHDDLPANVVTAMPDVEVMHRVSDKNEFAKICEEYGLKTPATQTVTISASAQIAPSEIAFPLIAKPARSSEFAQYYPQGFKKIYFIESQQELDKLWADLREVGFEGDFLTQQLIAGDDTYMDSITVYVNQAGKAVMFGSAQVLLEDHVPSMIGNPVAMLTRPMPELWDKISEMLVGIGYTGFANFDVKRDMNTGESYFLDLNPRIGRNSFYVCAAGINPMRVLVNDLLDGGVNRKLKADESVLYTLVPTNLLKKYVTNAELAAEVDEVVARGDVVNPIIYDADSAGPRMLGKLMETNQYRKFKRYYPEPTETAF